MSTTSPVSRPARMLIVAAVAASSLLGAMAKADRIPDAFNDTTRNATLWLEQESSNSMGCKVREASGKLRFEGRGVASSASYRLTKRFDWNDGFVVDWTQMSIISTVANAALSGRAGIAMGWGAFTATTGYQDGINIEVIRNSSSRRLVMSVRKGGQVVDSASCLIGSGEFDYRMVCSTGFGVSIDLYRDGGAMPVLSIDGVDALFADRAATGISVAFLAWSHAGITMDCRVDDFKAWGDLYDDSNDSLADDADSADDDDDKDGYDDSPDGDDDGDDNAARSVSVARFNASLTAALASSPLPILEAEVERQGSASLVSVLQWNAPASRLVEVRVNAATGAVVGSRTWTPSAMQLANYQDEIDALGSVTVPARNAVTSAVTGGATVAEVELESEDAGPIWKVKFVTPAGAEDEAEVDAS
jgi:uncharacterized membrane protein YkoI